MYTDDAGPSSSQALISFPPPLTYPNIRRTPSSSSPILEYQSSFVDQEQWQPILHSDNQVVLYNPRSHALTITSASPSDRLTSGVVVARRIRREEMDDVGRVIPDTCPYCKQTLSPGFRGYPGDSSTSEGGLHHTAEEADESEERWGYINSSDDEEEYGSNEAVSADPAYHSRASNYFRLLAIANDASSITSSPRRTSIGSPGFRAVDERESPVREFDERRRPRREGSRDRGRTRTPDNHSTKGAFPAEKMAEGYFKTFFQEEYKLGMGANGSVFLCQHVLDGNPLGHFAVKKIAVGESHSYLVNILKEVRLLERLHHPNIITYHHAWLENSQFSSFGPKVPTLHVLMQWAEGGSLDDFIDARLGRKPAHIHMHPMLSSTASIFPASVPPSPASSTNSLPQPNEEDRQTPITPTQRASSLKYQQQQHARFASEALPHEDGYIQQSPQHSASKPEDPQSRAARIRAFRAYQRAPPEEKERMRREMENLLGTGPAGGSGSTSSNRTEWTPVHLLSAQEVKSLFKDVVEGLAFLHDKSILHLDLKPGNVLLTWDEGKLIPRAMLSDFGTSRDMINSSRIQRSGNTGTLEYTAPESLPSPETGALQQIDSKADMWSLGMILHKLLFFKLPYKYAAVGDANGEPISQNDEAQKMDKLEKEVLTYPGFISTPDMVAGFETRRLPRTFLVLLENLLLKTPAGRPNCERVSSAIRDGKLDPLVDVPSQSLPLAMPRTEPSAAVTSSPSEQRQAEEHERTKLLALPSPVDVLGPDENTWRRWIAWKTWARFFTGTLFYNNKDKTRRKKKQSRFSLERNSLEQKRRGRLRWRLIRSSLLVVKALTVSRVCLDPTMRPRPAIVALLLMAAVADTVVDLGGSAAASAASDSVTVPGSRFGSEGRLKMMGCSIRGAWVTVGLALLHVGVLSLSAWVEHHGVAQSDRLGVWKTVCCFPSSNTIYEGGVRF